MLMCDLIPAGQNVTRRLRPWFRRMASTALAAAALLTAASSPAAQLTWDAGNTNNGGAIDAASGSWNLTQPATNFTASTTTVTTNNVNLLAGGIDWFQVNVPANAVAATNTLLYATNLPVNVWFSLTQTTNNVGDTLLMAGVTSGVSVLTTNTASAPTNIVPGGTYYLGIDNSANIDPVGYALEVNLSLSNAVITLTTNLNWNTGSANTRWTQTSTTVATNGATFAGLDAAAGTYQVVLDGPQIAVSNLTINANGYEFSGSPIHQSTNVTSAILSVSNGVSVTFNNLITGPNSTLNWRLGSGGIDPASMTLRGNFTAGQFSVGSTNGSTLWLGGAGLSSGGVFTINAKVIQTNGTWNNTSTWQVGRPGASIQPDAGKALFPGVFTLDGPDAILNLTKAMQISRNSGSGTVIISNGTVNMAAVAADGIVQVMSDGGGQGSFYMRGGTMNMGNGSSASSAGPIWLNKTTAPSNSMAIFSQSGGTINAWGGIQSGAASGTFANSTSAFTNSGGFLYIGNVGSVGIRRGAVYAPTNSFVFSGGTVGALQNWTGTAPLTLDTLNGNITFQCADAGASPFNISLSGALTGPGGLYKTGGGTLTLSGANNYSGSTVISNGTLAVTTAAAPTNGAVTLDGSAGTPGVTVTSNPSQFWSMGTLTFASGSPTAGFNFGSLQPSASVAPVKVAGNVAFTASPAVTITGTAIPVGTYPLIQYTGTVSGTVPTAPTLPGYISAGYVTNIAATKMVALVVTSSTYNPALSWRVGDDVWDINTTSNWTQFANPAKYTEGSAVIFDDSASGSSPITVTLNTNVNPSSMTANNTVSKDYTITGTGSIAGSSALSLLGGGSLTLTGTNTFNGGTTVDGSRLNINFGGSSAADSAIGTGPLTLALGSKIDNTSGQSVTLQPTIAQNWQDDWTFVGSTNLNTGSGAVTLGSSPVVLTVSSSKLEVGGVIADGGSGFKLQKAGSGTLTLGTDNTFSGGMQLDSGLLLIKTANGLGNGDFIISGSASFDNVSGADLAVTGITRVTLPTSATITYLGTSNSLNFGIVPLNQTAEGTKTLNVASQTVTFGDNFMSGNSKMIKTGQGKLVLGGSGTSQFVGEVNEGELSLAHDLGQAIGSGGATFGLLVQSNAVAKLAGTLQNQIPDGIPAKLNAGGILDMNGNSETVGTLGMTNGVLRNGLAATASTLTSASATLSSTNNVFDVPAADASLIVVGDVTGTGSLVKTGLGSVNLTNSYTGDTTVSNGTLVLNLPLLATNSTVTVNTNGVLTLNFAGSETNTVAALVLNGVSKPVGVYNASTDPVYLAGTGSLEVPAAVSPVSTNADLISLVLSPAGTLFPSFASNVVTYAATNAYVDSPTVTVVNADLTATNQLIFNGSTNALASGVASGPLSLTLGINNPVVVQVTAQDGLTVKTYTVNVTRQPSLTPVTLTNSVSGSTLTLSWPADHLGYSLQSQTNSRSLGLTTTWVALPGSELVTTTNLPIDKLNPTVFYRLVYP